MNPSPSASGPGYIGAWTAIYIKNNYNNSYYKYLQEYIRDVEGGSTNASSVDRDALGLRFFKSHLFIYLT